MKNKWIVSLVLCTILFRFSAHADEGMWIPLLLKKNMARMHQLGFKLTAEDIYSINHSSLKDAIVKFGGGCTGEVVSPQGLLLTNHHCGYGVIQRHSSLEHDYLTDGYWAKTMEDELPNPGLTVTFMVRMENVTDQVLEDVTSAMTEAERDQLVKKHIKEIEKSATEGTHYEADVVSYYHGNQYYLIVTEVFKDIRFVGAPPSGIGKFGGDTDNWMWPRHTGDFSVFRIYADSNNQPAPYSENNVPYKPKKYLSVSLEGYEQGDFALLFGNPGRTNEYLPACAVEKIAFEENPIMINLRQQRLDIIQDAMDKSRLVRIQYASKHSRISNYWKKMIGETRGIRRADAVEQKKAFENQFQNWAEAQSDQPGYQRILPMFDSLYDVREPSYLAYIYLREAGFAPELLMFSLNARDLIRQANDKTVSDEDFQEAVADMQKGARGFYKDYQPAIDRQIARVMLQDIQNHMDPSYLSETFGVIDKQYKGDVEAFVDDLYDHSVFADSVQLYELLDKSRKGAIKKMAKDPAYELATAFYDQYRNRVLPELRAIQSPIDSLQRIYMKALMEMDPDHLFYPDANSTMRVCFGQVDGFEPADAVTYTYFTTADGILEKEDSTIYDYAVEERLKELIREKDFGRYADDDGTLHVAFISTIHSTGGNSGAPVLNDKGELIGINFDRNWEGTMSDLMYDPDQCRNIVLDIRYLLFIMDKYAGATRLVEEMDIR